MISHQSIAIGTAAVGLIGKEADLFRFTVKHSFSMLFIICILTMLQAYVFPWIIPVYSMIGSATASVTDVSKGFTYLLILAVIVIVLILTVWLLNRRRISPTMPSHSVNP
jgi:lactate permease